LKTVEIIVEEKPGKPSLRYRDTDLVAVTVSYTEKALRDMLKKAAGGRWDPEGKHWWVPYGSIRGNAGLVERIVKD
jgi:hypothetical protein